MVTGRIRSCRNLARPPRQERQTGSPSDPWRRELRALRELRRQVSTGNVFETERGTPFTTDPVNRLVKRIGERASLPFKVHVHMLRHACGYARANEGHATRAIQDWLGPFVIRELRAKAQPELAS